MHLSFIYLGMVKSGNIYCGVDILCCSTFASLVVIWWLLRHYKSVLFGYSSHVDIFSLFSRCLAFCIHEEFLFACLSDRFS